MDRFVAAVAEVAMVQTARARPEGADAELVEACAISASARSELRIEMLLPRLGGVDHVGVGIEALESAGMVGAPGSNGIFACNQILSI